MDLHPHLRASIFLFFLLINIIFVVVPTPASGIDDQYLNCSTPFNCSNLQSIGYPFWGGNRPEYCGYPGFELDCEGEVAEITISKITYRIPKIDNQSRKITVARDDYWDDNCPSKFVNTSLNFSLVDYAPDTKNLTLYYSCPSSLMYDVSWAQLPNQFKCSSDESNTKNYYFSSDFKSFNNSFTDAFQAYLGSCENSAIIPVWQSTLVSIVNNLNSVNLTRSLQEGFGLEWFANNSLCEECERSNGQCGYATRTGQFTCYCPDKPYSSSCGSGKGKSISAGTGVGIAVASVAVISLGVCFFLILRRRRKIAAQNKSRDLQTPPSSKSTTTTPLTKSSQSIPPYPYSKSDLERGSTYFGAHVFSCAELEEATDNFDSSKELGDGGFGTVYHGVLRDGRVVAVKRLYENNFKRAEQFKNEIEILTRLQHPNLVKLYGCTSRHSRELLLVYEFIANGTVADHLHGRQSKSILVPWPVRLSIAIETADALAYLHASDVIHRDVKTNNILLDNDFQVKVADFGLSRLFPTDVTHVSTAPQGTPGYVDPEYYQCYKLTDKSDVYSFGVVLIELISGLPAVDTNRERLDINLANMAVNKIQNKTLNELVDPFLGFEKNYAVRSMITSVAELAFRCLQQDRDMRPTMKEVLENLKATQNEHLGTQKAQVVDIRSTDDAVLLKNNLTPLTSPGSETDKWMKIRTL
ncbi:Wall-associated receptor kinase [Melia azedarach]|uniref:Wall-associated receptor kinase n=1 Tax=Melia azedarach TaxID=155640 RepID=A0ACC1X8P4_MELAZ|nr:Wall-associated receptor kinase [Melia azedarach]